MGREPLPVVAAFAYPHDHGPGTIAGAEVGRGQVARVVAAHLRLHGLHEALLDLAPDLSRWVDFLYFLVEYLDHDWSLVRALLPGGPDPGADRRTLDAAHRAGARPRAHALHRPPRRPPGDPPQPFVRPAPRPRGPRPRGPADAGAAGGPHRLRTDRRRPRPRARDRRPGPLGAVPPRSAEARRRGEPGD